MVLSAVDTEEDYGNKNGRFTFLQVEWECIFHSLRNRHVQTLYSQVKKWSEALWSYVYLHGK